MHKKKVHIQAKRKIRIHNDIGNAAFYFKERVNERSKRGDRDGISHEILAALTLLAFETEARFNFLGQTLVDGWDERTNFFEKIKKVCATLELTPDFNTRPYLNIDKLQKLQDTFAHGKPQEISLDKEVTVTTDAELEAAGILKADWETYVDESLLKEAYEDAETIWRDLLTKAKLNVFDTLSSGERQISFIENVP